MDLHIYRNSQDRWHHLKSAALERGAVLAINALTLEELVQRLTPDVKVATPGIVCAFVSLWLNTQPEGGQRHKEVQLPNFIRYACDAITELKAARIRPSDLRAADSSLLADLVEHYDQLLHAAGLVDPQDRRALAASRVKEGAAPEWLGKFERVVLHALYDLTESEFLLIRALIERLPEGGAVVLFNTTSNVKPTQFAEWTWQRFINDESLAEKTFPEFCRPSHVTRPVLERLFVFDEQPELPPDDSLRVFEAAGRYKEAEKIGADIVDLLAAGHSAADIAVVVRHIETYGEMLEDVFQRYGIPHSFETGVPLVRIPLIKYWLAVLDLVSSERAREPLARVMSSAYYEPRLSPKIDAERTLETLGYIDRNHLRASALAARRNSPLTAELQRFENWLDQFEGLTAGIRAFVQQLQIATPLTERDRQAWRAMVEELDAVGAVYDRPGADRAPLQFAEFRRIASEIAGLRTVDRLTRVTAAPGIPRVRILSPHGLGYRDYKWIFAPGFADGEFPARSFSNPLLPDELVEAVNARLRPRRLMTSRDRSRRDPLYLFMILDSAAKQVTLTYPGNTLEGERVYPSVYVAEIARHYAEPPIERAAPAKTARAEGEWLKTVAEEWRRGLFTDERALELLGADIVERTHIERKGPARAQLSRGALPLDGIWHPSELNSLASCPFVFVARHRLRLRAPEIPDFEVPALEVGILAHEILRDFYSEKVPASLEEARVRMNAVVARRLASADVSGQGPYSVFDPSLWKIRRRQLVSVLDQYVTFAVRDELDGFETQSEYLDSALPPAALGGTRLAGKPDHVAVHRSNGAIDAIRIDDFKYSAASTFTTKQLRHSFQIPVYAYLAVKALAAEPGTRIEGRYLLLRSPGNPVLSHAIDEMVFEDVRIRIDDLLSRVRDGRLAPDPADKQDCGECGYRRLCRFYGG